MIGQFPNIQGEIMANKPNAPVKDWALLAYIAGDNDLSDAGLKDIREMCKEGSSQNTHVGVQIDTRGEHTGAMRYEISMPDWSGKAHRLVIDRIPEPDTGDPEVLKSFLEWGFGRYPARNTVVVVWNHGAGFKTRRRDIAYDDYGTSLDMNEISGVFERVGYGGKLPKISILGFDACLMNCWRSSITSAGMWQSLSGRSRPSRTTVGHTTRSSGN